MKKLIAITVLSIFAMMAMNTLMIFPVAAQEGTWITTGYPTDDDVYYTPIAGYHYTENGFETISPDYTDRGPYQQARTRNAVDLKADNDGRGNSVSLKMTMLEYAYDGPEQNKDQWIAITINSQPDAYPGSLEYGEGMCILFRRNAGGNSLGEGITQVESFYVDKEGKAFSLLPVGFRQVDVPINEHGQETYEFTMKYSDKGYSYSVNGYEFPIDDYLTYLLYRTCADGAYIGITVQTGYKASPISFAVNEWQGTKPTGEDYKAPQDSPAVSDETTEYRTEEDMTTPPDELETTAPYPYETIIPETNLDTLPVWDLETHIEIESIYDDEHADRTFFGNGLIAELFGESVFYGCNSLVAAPVITLLMIMGAALIFHKKD